MVRIVGVSAALLPILAGCAAPSAHLVNDKGQKTQCSAFGLGLLGSFIALTWCKIASNRPKSKAITKSPQAGLQPHRNQRCRRSANHHDSRQRPGGRQALAGAKTEQRFETKT